ncbi:hypothetical protein [Frateuria sp. Soil773]|uniref:hypothetical protein n=1 Tax=Frateuria sp. Soil773 TaxID=1736407 RepID=UPI0019106D38|nr:hypothetical protein [Frateuria sp. Soil773]
MANENMRLSAAGYAALRTNEGVVMHYYDDTGNNCTWVSERMHTMGLALRRSYGAPFFPSK